MYRFLYPEVFRQASQLLSVTAGTVNTVVLITSSLTVALAHHLVVQRKGRQAALCLAPHAADGARLPGGEGVRVRATTSTRGCSPAATTPPPALAGEAGGPMFFTVYFLITGLHALHVIVGMTVLAVLMVQCARGRYDHGYVTPVELGGMYWHLVDLIWIFLFPLIYLI